VAGQATMVCPNWMNGCITGTVRLGFRLPTTSIDYEQRDSDTYL